MLRLFDSNIKSLPLPIKKKTPTTSHLEHPMNLAHRSYERKPFAFPDDLQYTYYHIKTCRNRATTFVRLQFIPAITAFLTNQRTCYITWLIRFFYIVLPVQGPKCHGKAKWRV